MELKDRLKQAIRHSGHTQVYIADQIQRMPGGEKFIQQTLSALTSGRVKTSTYIPHIAHACDVGAYWLATGEGDISAHKAPPKSLSTDPKVVQVIQHAIAGPLYDHYKNLPPSAQVSMILELYMLAYADRALMEAIDNMQPSTLLRMFSNPS